MKSHADFYPLVMPAVPNCPSMTVDLALNRAAHEFCSHSRCWEQPLDPFVLRAGQDRYELEVPTGAVMVCVQTVTVREHDLAPVRRARDLRRVEIHGTPYAFAFDDTEEPAVLVSPVPNEDDAGVMVEPICTLAPSFNATSLPDVLAVRYMDAIAEGAKFYLKTMTGTPWFDPDGAQLAGALFAQRKAEARIQKESGFVASSMRVTPRPFA